MLITKKIIIALIAAAVLCAPAFSQVQSTEDIELPPAQFQDHGGVTPWFWIGLQTVFSGGYNIETTAMGFRNYGGDNHTYASFNLAFVDSHYQTPKFYEVPRQLDPDAWTGHFVMLNFTSRINSWGGGTGTTGLENNAPAWLTEITGKGFRIGFFTQAADLIGGIEDSNRNDENNSKPANNSNIAKISGGNKVLSLQEGQLGRLYYEKATDSTVTTTYNTASSTNAGAIMYTGYEKKELFNVYLTMLSEGNVNSDVTKDNDGKERNKGFAGVVDFGITPFGLIADDENKITLDISGNFITGFNWINSTENYGFGLKTEAGFWLMDNFVVAPLVAFDFKNNIDNKNFYRFGGGLNFRFSGMRWVHDDWGDLYNSGYTWNTNSWSGNGNFANYRYENNKVLKYAYAQVYAATLPDPNKPGNFDLNLLFRMEEPDGGVGFHEKLGAMAELRVYNMLEKEFYNTDGETKKDKNELSWEAQGRISWDINLNQHLVIPYIRGYINADSVLKARIGAYANFIPFTGFELAYTSANLNKGVSDDLRIPGYLNSSYEKFYDAGRVEFIVILKSDEIRPQVPKRMSDWNYPNTIQDY